jgi:hypothetical protein
MCIQNRKKSGKPGNSAGNIVYNLLGKTEFYLFGILGCLALRHPGSSNHWDQQQGRANGVRNLFVNPSNYGYSKNFVELIVHSKIKSVVP